MLTTEFETASLCASRSPSMYSTLVILETSLDVLDYFSVIVGFQTVDGYVGE